MAEDWPPYIRGSTHEILVVGICPLELPVGWVPLWVARFVARFVKATLGHADISTTGRYLGA